MDKVKQIGVLLTLKISLQEISHFQEMCVQRLKGRGLRARNPGDRTRSFGCPREGRKTVFLYITPSNSISHFRVFTG